MTIFEFETKAGNRAIRKLGRTIGNNLKLKPVTGELDPLKRRDGNNNGRIFDNTILEQPAIPNIAPKNKPRQTRTAIPMSRNRPTGSQIPPTQALTRQLKAKKGYPDSLRGKTPEQIAEIVILRNGDDQLDSLAEFRTGSVEQWSEPQIYDKAYESAREMAKSVRAELLRDDIASEYLSEKRQALLKEFIVKSLKENPLFYELVQEFGFPKISFALLKDNNISGFYINQVNTIYLNSINFDEHNEAEVLNDETNNAGIYTTRDGRLVVAQMLSNSTNYGTLAHEYGHYLHERLRLQAKYGSGSNTRRNNFLYPKNNKNNHPLTQNEIEVAYRETKQESIGVGRARESKNEKILHVDTVYAETNSHELFAESVGALLRRDEHKLLNDYTIEFLARLLGLPIEKSNGYNSVRITDPTKKLQPNGRPLLPMLPKNKPNVGLKSKRRLHDLPNPVFTEYGRSTQTLNSIGDHRFYEYGRPSLYFVGDRRTRTEALSAGSYFLNNEIHGNLVRSISRAQMGFPINDMPLVGNESSSDIQVYKALISGQISNLPDAQRKQLEKATRDVAKISIGVQDGVTATKPLYRALEISPDKFLRSLGEGDELPLPITSFGDAVLDDDNVVLKLTEGARVLQIDDEYITQGTFRVKKLERDKNKITAELEHIETFDPRHNAMRAVSSEDTPYTMRTRGLASRRWSNDEAEAITKDKNDRVDITFSDVDITADDREMIDFLISEELEDTEVLDKIKNKIKRFVQDKIDSRLIKHQAFMRERYSENQPYKEDSESLSDWKTNEKLFTELNSKVKDFLSNDLKKLGRDEFGEYYYANDYDFSAYELEQFLQTGILNYSTRKFDDKGERINSSVEIPLTETDLETLRKTVNALRAVERAYLNNQTFTVGNEDKIDIRVEGKARITLGRDSEYRIAYDAVLVKPEIIRRSPLMLSDYTNDIRVAVMTRRITKDSVGHLTFFVEDEYMRYGIAGILNSHSYAWWRRAGINKIKLSPAVDGVFVWQLLGFEPENADALTESVGLEALITPLQRELKYYLQGSPEASGIITDDASAARVAWWIRNAQRNPNKIDLITLANSFVLTKTNKQRISDFFRYDMGLMGNLGYLTLDLSDRPTGFMPSEVLPQDTIKFTQQAQNLGVRSRSQNGATSSFHLIDNDDPSAPISQRQASYIASAIRDGQQAFTDSTQEDRYYRSDFMMNPLLDAAGYNLPPLLITKDNASALLQKQLDGKPLYIPIARGYGLKAYDQGLDVDASARRWMTGSRELSNRLQVMVLGGGDYFSSKPAKWVGHYGALDANRTFISPLDANNKSGVLALIPPSARIGSLNDYLQVRYELTKLFQPKDSDRNYFEYHDFLQETFQGNTGLGRLLTDYVKASSVNEQRVRRGRVMTDRTDLKPSTRAILNLIWELEDSKTDDNFDEISKVQRVLARPTEVMYGILHGFDIFQGESDFSNDGGSTPNGTTFVVLNRSAMVSVDTPLSFSEIVEITGSDGGPEYYESFTSATPKDVDATEKRFIENSKDLLLGYAFGIDKRRPLKSQPQKGLKSRADTNRYASMYQRLKDSVEKNKPISAPFFISDVSSIKEIGSDLAIRWNLYTEQLKDLRQRHSNAEVDALTDDQLSKLENEIEALIGKMETTAQSWDSYVGTANRLSREKILVMARKEAILSVLRKAEAYLGEEYESNPLVQKLRRELDKISAREEKLSKSSTYKTDGTNLKDADEYSRVLRNILQDLGGPALGDLAFPENENDDDTMNSDFQDEFQSLMIDAEDAKAIPENEPYDDADKDNRRVSMTGVPVDALRKIKAMMARARHKNTPAPEAEVAVKKATELMAKHRPDLANESFLRGLRSSSQRSSRFQPTSMPANMQQAAFKEKYTSTFKQFNQIRELMPKDDEFFPQLINISTSDNPDNDEARNRASLMQANKDFDDATAQWLKENQQTDERMKFLIRTMDELLEKLITIGDKDLVSEIKKVNAQLLRGMLTQNEYYSYLSTLITLHEPEFQSNRNLRQNRQEKSAFSPLWVDLAANSFQRTMRSADIMIKGEFTKPDLHNRLKSEILDGSRGGASGQWTEHKSRLLTNSYRNSGGAVKTSRRPSRKQMALKKWTKKSYKKKLGEEIGRKYVRSSTTLKERAKKEEKK